MNHLLLMLISLKISGLNITHLLKEGIKVPAISKDEIVIDNVDPVVPTTYSENHLFLLG